MTLKKYSLNPIGIQWIFIVANMIPSLLLFTSEPYSLAHRVAMLMSALAGYLIIFSIHKNIGRIQLILFPLSFINAFQIVVFSLFGESVIAVDMFLNLMTTNASEAGELLDNMIGAIIFVCAVYIPTFGLAIYSSFRKIYTKKDYMNKCTTAGLAILLTAMCILFLPIGNRTIIFKNDVYPINVFQNLSIALKKWNKSEQYKNETPVFHFNAQKKEYSEEREIYVLVIGEAGRAANWSLAGYERETNPLLTKRKDLVFFKDALTQANATHKSVPMILSAADAENYEDISHQKSVISAFKEAGFTTLFISNQPPNRSFTDVFAKEADHYVNIRQQEENDMISKNQYDGNMLSPFQNAIDSVQGNLFVVLHSYGSHFNYKERYPQEMAYFRPDCFNSINYRCKKELVNAYDNSIRYTDYFLANVIDLLEKTDDCTAMFYTTDHGEDLMDDERKRFLHASPIPTYYQLHIPMLMWFSPRYRVSFPGMLEYAYGNRNLPTSTRSAFHTLMDMARIQTPFMNAHHSLVNKAYSSNTRYYLNDHDIPVEWMNAGIKGIDKKKVKIYGLKSI